MGPPRCSRVPKEMIVLPFIFYIKFYVTIFGEKYVINSLYIFRNCPIDLKEAVSSVVFASPRCADIPELVDIRKHFTAKYGKDFISAAVELRPDCGVNRTVSP